MIFKGGEENYRIFGLVLVVFPDFDIICQQHLEDNLANYIGTLNQEKNYGN